jgi:hypothetical protein
MRHHLNSIHVDLIKVWSFFPIDFDIHKVIVHQPGDFFILKRFVRHHMAPVTRRITYAQEDRLVLLARNCERLLAPRIPVDGVMSVLQ